MAQAKQKHPEAKKDNSSDRSGSIKDAETIAREAGSSVRKQEEYVSNRVDQLGSILAKGFDLAETGITLGVNLLNRLGSVVGDQIINRADNNVGNTYAEPQGMPPNQPPGGGGMPMYQNMQDMPEPVREVDSPPASIVVNRLPLFPGSPVQVSFSVNNDSQTSPKRIRLRLEGFVGEMQGTELSSEDFSIKPATKVVAPMDFDKFTIIGTIPQEAPSDAYNGWIVVLEGQEEIRIPVRLFVTTQPQ